jgi:hypothetical protein
MENPRHIHAVAPHAEPVPDQRMRKRFSLPRIRTASDTDAAKASSPTTGMAVLLGYRQGHNGTTVHTYAGTVAKATVLKRRAANRRARAARRLNRR